MKFGCIVGEKVDQSEFGEVGLKVGYNRGLTWLESGSAQVLDVPPSRGHRDETGRSGERAREWRG